MVEVWEAIADLIIVEPALELAQSAVGVRVHEGVVPNLSELLRPRGVAGRLKYTGARQDAFRTVRRARNQGLRTVLSYELRSLHESAKSKDVAHVMEKSYRQASVAGALCAARHSSTL